MKIAEILQKGVCSLVSLCIFAMPGWASGGETNMGAVGREAQAFVKELQANALPASTAMQGSTIVLPMGNGTTMSIDQSELAPQTSGTSQYEYGYSNADIKSLEAIYDQGQEMDIRGAAAKKNLYQDSLLDNPSTIEGNVYKVMTKMYYDIERPDMSNDSVFDTTKDIIANLVEITQGFADCSADTVLNKVTNKKHVADYRTCNKVLDRSGTCTLTHRYTAGVIEHYDGPYNLDECGEGCMTMWIGKVGDNYWDGNCKIFEEYTRVRVINPGAVRKATLEYVKWDDYMQVLVGPPGREKLFWQGPNKNFPPETSGACELSTSWEQTVSVDVTSAFKNVAKDTIVSFLIRVSVSGSGEGFGRIRLFYDSDASIVEEEWAPPECVEALHAVTDGFADGESYCTKMPPLNSDGRCTTMNGVILCPENMVKPPNSDINPLCQEMHFETDWNFYQGSMDCWIDANGNKQCPDNVGGNLDDCKQYEDDPKCTFIKSECVDGAQGASGTCYVTEMTYDCGEDVLISDTEASTNYKCPGDVACMGNECIDTSKTVSNSFAEVTALLNALQYMTQDMECVGLDEDEQGNHTENVTCTVFGGEAGECKKAVGGMQNCCEPVPGIGLSDYITLIKTTAKVNAAANSIASNGKLDSMLAEELAGQWVHLKGEAAEVVKEGLSWINDDFSSAIDNIGGFVTDIFGDETSKGLLTGLEEKLKSYATELLTDLFKEMGVPITNAAGSTTASSAATAVVEGTMMVFAVVSWIYTAYVIANLIVQIVYACETEEYEMISQKQLGNCHKVGSYCKSKVLGACIEKREVYCCYKSPLSRIMNEQIRLQGDILGEEFDGWGDPEHPKCEGIPLDKVGEVDWDRVDLSEWIALLEQTGNLPDDDTISIEKLTGKGSAMDMTGDRLNTIDRTLQRLDGADIDGVRSEANDALELDTGYAAQPAF